MKETPPVLVWTARSEEYASALRERLPGIEVEAREVEPGELEGVPKPEKSDPAASRIEPSDASTPTAAENEPDLIPGREPDLKPTRGFPILLSWKYPPGGLRSLPDLAWIQVAGAGVDHVLNDPDLGPDVRVTRSLARFGAQVGEYVVGYLLAHLLDIERYREHQSEHRWVRAPRPLLADLTVGVVGLGALGRATVERLAPFGTTILGVRNTPEPVDGVAELFTTAFDASDPAHWHRMLPRCDVLVLTAPRTPETEGMIDSEVLDLLPEGAILINVARGALVDESAMIAALQSGRLAAAVLDVFHGEPLPENHPLWDLLNARLTPHIAAPSEPGPIASEFAENYRRFVAGEKLLNLVERERGY